MKRRTLSRPTLVPQLYGCATAAAPDGQIGEASLVDRVRSLIAKGLPIGAANMTGIAALLRMSPSTLRRKLAQEGASHRALNQAVRISLASTHLERDDASVAEAAAVAGYDDVSSFHRAFKRWTGRTPAEHRAGHSIARRRAGSCCGHNVGVAGPGGLNVATTFVNGH